MSTTAIKETGILFSAPMIRALNREENPKSQTRRLRGLDEVNADPGSWSLHSVGILDAYVKPKYKGRFGAYFQRERDGALQILPVVCPYGGPGDLLWVRETWNVRGLCFGMKPRLTKAAAPDAWVYAADDKTDWPHGWKPGIHMPRWASRITLQNTDVRVLRLQEISEADVVAEGTSYGNGVWTGLLRIEFAESWDKLNGDTLTWAFNPWVWCLSFNRLSPAGAPKP